MTTSTAVSTWDIDPVHSVVAFAVKHLGISTFRGRFSKLEGTIQIDEANPEKSSVTASVDVASIDLANERLFGHVNSAEFLHAEQYPKMTFRSTNVQRVDDEHWKITGDLTIRNVARPVTLDTEYHGQAKHPFSGKTVAAFTARTSIKRPDFDLNWNVVMDTGAQYLGEHVDITLDIEAIRRD